ncbi:transient receptor potential cation channel subfamily A member 1-like isoform X2 [Clytia hemisphaerica]|uniref:transient receptor potential cation channel subfamily A member 1-like isoform X2 n=1 Tax=Clytia hemisphaerica TaxID=252671 RepID=UPI0034D41689
MPVGSQTDLNVHELDDTIDLTIFEAAREGCLEKIITQIEYLKREDDIKRLLEQRNQCEETPLHVAAKYNQENIIRYLVNHNVWIDVPDQQKNTPLHTAIKNDSKIATKTLVEMGANVHLKNDYGLYPIHFAASRGNKDLCRILVSYKEVDVNVTDHGLCTPLHIAVGSQQAGTVQLLLSHKANPYVQDLEGRYPLHIAASDGSDAIIEILVKAMKRFTVTGPHANVDVQNNEQKTPLHMACLHGHVKSVTKLLEHQADVNCQCSSKITPMHLAAIYGRDDVIKILVKYGSKLNKRDTFHMTPLHRACLYGRINVISLLYTLGAHLELRNETGFTPLLCAVWSGSIDVVRYLLNCGVNFEAIDNTERNVLHIAAQKKQHKLLEVLLQHKGILGLINNTDQNNWTPLHYATYFMSVKCQRILLDHQSTVTARNKRRKTPIHFASCLGKPAAVHMLCEVSRDCIDQTDDSLKTPLMLAAINGNIQICEVLISYGADVEKTDDLKMTVLHYACQNGYPEIVKMLLESSANVDATNLNFETPLHLAAKNGKTDCMEALIDSGAQVVIKDKSGKNCLDKAIENYKKNACIYLLRDKHWKQLMQNVDFNGNRPMDKMIERMPAVAEIVLDNCIETSNLEKEHIDYSITYYFDFVALTPEPGSKSNKVCGPSIMAKNNRETLLAHPVTICFINSQWKLLPRIYRSPENSTSNITNTSFPDYQDTVFVNPTCEATSMMVISITLIIYSIIQLFKEFIQFIMSPFDYIMDLVNYIEIGLYVTSLIFVTTYFMDEHYRCLQMEHYDNEALRVNAGAVAIMLAFCNMLFYMKRAPFVGLIVLMFIEVLKTVISVLLIFGFIIVGFALSFHFISGDWNDGPDADFFDMKKSIIKVVAMTIGDGSMSKGKKRGRGGKGGSGSSIAEMTDYLYLVFALLLPIVMVNLMIGLAVGEIANVTRTAKLCMLKDQVYLVTNLQSKYPESYLKLHHQSSVTVYPNKRNLWEKFTDWLQAYTYDSLASFSENDDEEQNKRTDNEALVKEQINSINKKMKRMSRQNEEQADIMRKILEILNGVSSESVPSPPTSRRSSVAPLIRLNDSPASPSPVDKMIKSTIFEE